MLTRSLKAEMVITENHVDGSAVTTPPDSERVNSLGKRKRIAHNPAEGGSSFSRRSGDSKRKRGNGVQGEIPRVSEVQLRFPGCVNLAPKIYARSRTTPLAEGDKSQLPSECTYEQVASRLFRLMDSTKEIAIFPWPVISLKKVTSRSSLHRSTHKRYGDELFAYTASSFLAWELGKRSLRLGLFISAQRQGKPSHVWALGISSMPGETGKRVIIYDSFATYTFEQLGNTIYRSDMPIPQRTCLEWMTENKGKFNIVETWWGGKLLTRRITDPCLESTMRWLETFRGKSGISVEELQSTGFVLVKSNPGKLKGVVDDQVDQEVEQEGIREVEGNDDDEGTEEWHSGRSREHGTVHT
ncbi:hypothetical protein V865_005624 [Kwoniella europaea PYCC6329]|uniref:Ubiquitin-like protease family profile domain-containing protein n=1 Tax=Kwoniella europaea PYCC6329 TaxID=1423913 RepID=A0AAX4KQA3_9TREE